MQKTPNKSENKGNINVEKTPDKISASTPENKNDSHTLNNTPDNKNDSPTSNNTEKYKSRQFTTPKKIQECTETLKKSPENSVIEPKTLENKVEGLDSKSENLTCDGENEMISTTEQARLLIAASRTPSKSLSKTPSKQSTPTGKRSIENSPVTPGKFRRVELITIASPKAKRIKQFTF